jgi:hypothetical protein
MFKDGETIAPGEEYEVLNALFADVDAFCPDPRLRLALAGCLDEEQLRQAADSALKELLAISADRPIEPAQ